MINTNRFYIWLFGPFQHRIWRRFKIRIDNFLFDREMKFEFRRRLESKEEMDEFIESKGGDRYLERFIETDPEKNKHLTVPLEYQHYRRPLDPVE